MAGSRPSHPQDWRFLAGIFSIGSFLEMVAWGHLLAFTPLFLRSELNVDPQAVPWWTGILASSSLAIALPLSPIWGILADRYSRKVVMLRSLVIEALVFALVAISGDVWQLLGARLLMGFSYGNIAVVMATQSMVTPERRVGFALGIIQMSMTLGFSVGPLLGSLIINTLGLRAMFGIDALLIVGSALLIALAFREPDVHDRNTPFMEKLRLVLQQVTQVPAVRWNFIAWFLVYGGASALDPFLPVLVERLVGPADSATVIGALLAAYGFLTALGTPLAGRLADRVGAARLFLLVAPSLALIAAAFGFVASLPGLVLLVILRALPQAGTAVVLYSHLAANVPIEHRASVMSLTPMPRNAAWLVVPAVAGAASGYGLSTVFWLAAALFAGAAIMAVLMLKSSSKPDDSLDVPAG